jgi:hypothetical protein
MRTRKKELEVDFIGGSAPLTKEEEMRISEIIKRRKTKQRVTAQKPRKKSKTNKNITA